ncbi:hypothetical protein EZV62_008747 [Acer yangbiense]|uniref:phosphatidate cytidylyltransferase n=1 Tax=Acer yangbiense TaxID=1000413 RepID=A0A5C7IET1_9ROSI|nr:hypothetical protein EZV62_008747 [Acer yangbiense]
MPCYSTTWPSSSQLQIRVSCPDSTSQSLDENVCKHLGAFPVTDLSEEGNYSQQIPAVIQVSRTMREVPSKGISVLPVQWHALCLGLFASIIAPFGGFFASGFKRAFKIKDFGDSIPGHGGVTDRNDCQMVMAVFAYIYHQSFVVPQSYSVEIIMDEIMSLNLDQQQALHVKLGQILHQRQFGL